jgi:endogenous inhibitor of DNA gyrase (YacG/DUF329 family)
MAKYGLEKPCKYCGDKFITKPRFLDYCSQKCKNPLNRGEYDPWNKGIKLTEEQKAKQNTSGLVKGWGWNKGGTNEVARQRMLGENNPNWNGRLNNLRPKDPNVPAYRKYLGQVRKATYRTIKKMKINNEWVPKTGKYKDDWQIDHIVPCRQGFDLGIPAEIIGRRDNIQFIKGSENRSKWHTYQPLDVVKYITGETYGVF